jgi:hypothetical protein
MAHHLVRQLHFARSEFIRCLDGISADESLRRFEPMNCISWMVGHLADQENTYWVLGAQNLELAPSLHELVGFGRPASTPQLEEMWDLWKMITKAADRYLESISPEMFESHLEWRGRRRRESVGTMLLRNTYHYWFHLGEAHAVRQLLGHTNLPQFVGDMTLASYHHE